MKKGLNIAILLVFLVWAGYYVYANFFYGGIGGGTKDLTTIDSLEKGQAVNLNDYLGKKKLILQFVAVPCDCCSYTIPFMKEIAAEQDEIQLITVVFSGKESKIAEKFAEYKMNYPWGLDLDRSIANHYGATTSPTFVFFDEKGNLLGSYPYVVANKESLLNNYQGYYNDYYQKKGSDKL